MEIKMKFRELCEASEVITVADKIKKTITDPDYISIYDGSRYDLENNSEPYCVWVGYKHKGGRSDPKKMRAVENKLKDIVKVFADVTNSSVNDVVVKDCTDELDAYKLYIVK